MIIPLLGMITAAAAECGGCHTLILAPVPERAVSEFEDAEGLKVEYLGTGGAIKAARGSALLIPGGCWPENVGMLALDGKRLCGGAIRAASGSDPPSGAPIPDMLLAFMLLVIDRPPTGRGAVGGGSEAGSGVELCSCNEIFRSYSKRVIERMK